MQLPQWLEGKREAAKVLAEQKAQLRYGLTIRLDTRNISLNRDASQHSEQVITLEHENCDIHNLFDVLDNEDVKKHLLSIVPANKTPFSASTEAQFDIGLVIIVPSGQNATVDLTRTLTSETFVEHVLIIAKPNSSLTFVDKHTSTACKRKAATVEIIAQKDARVKFASVQALTQDCIDNSSYRATTAQGAKIDWFIASLGASLTHANVDTYLQGEASESRSYGVFLGKDAQQFDISASTFHTGNKSSSDMYTRGVLLDKSKAVYRGNIDIAAKAFDCNGYQTEETLLIGDNAVADAIPNLEIRNNQVKCSHGATIGRIDEEQLFYLRSRGIHEQEAIKMIIEGFFEPLTTKLEWPELFEIIQPLVHEKIQ